MADPLVTAELLLQRGQALRDALADPGPDRGPNSWRVPADSSNQIPCPYRGTTPRFILCPYT